MKVRPVNSVECETIPGTDLKGKALVRQDDDVGFQCYELILESTSVELKSPSTEVNHIYYCISGSAEVSHNDVTYDLNADVVIALTGSMCPKLTVQEAVRFFVTYVKASGEVEPPEKPACKSLSDILKTEMNVDWQRGFSRRYLAQRDGFNISLHNTLCFANNDNPMEYPGNVEAVYFLDGELEYAWNEGQDSHKHNCSRNKQESCMFLIEHDKHNLKIGSEDAIAICVFFPALVGNETHTFNVEGSGSKF